MKDREDIALGMIETIGLVGLIEAADAACKAAKVRVVDYEMAEGGLVIIKMRGSVAAVKAAVEAGAAAAQRVGQLWATHVIPNPDPQIDFMITRKKPPEKGTAPEPSKETPPQPPKEKTKEHPDVSQKPFKLSTNEGIEEIIEKVKYYGIGYLNTKELRRLVRNIENFPYPPGISGKMKREEIINELAKRGLILPGDETPIFPSGE
ncbi:MAG: BMC domain-containing protein, partial [bacterium]